MRLPVGLFLLAAAVAAAVPGSARAGAWVREPGDGISIVTAARRVSPVGSLTGGVPDRESTISQTYIEYGLLEDLTVGGKFYTEFSTVEPNRSAAALGVFLRRRLWHSDHSDRAGVASIELGYSQPVDELIGGIYAEGDPGAVPEANVAALYGRSWWGAWGNAFLSTGAAYHWRDKALADELRFEVTGGYSPTREFMGIVSLFGLTPLGSGTDASLRISPSIAYTHHPKPEEGEAEGEVFPVTFQFGVSYDLLQPETGLGFSLSVWRRF